MHQSDWDTQFMTQIIKTIPSDPSRVKNACSFFSVCSIYTYPKYQWQLWYSPIKLKQQRQEVAFEQSSQDEFSNDRATHQDVLTTILVSSNLINVYFNQVNGN
jgi:hypothetical protein